VSAWLHGAAAPPALAGREPVADSIRLQDRLAERLWDLRQRSGALELDTGETRAVVRDGQVVDLVAERLTRAQRLIAEAMIASNGVVARFLSGRGLPAIRRVVREPRRWDRIVALARLHGGQLPSAPDAPALEAFLHQQRAADPERFTDLSLAVVKLIGRGEYALERPGETSGHFGLAVRDYVHSTAPNRRFPDLVAHRAVKAALAGRPQPYGESELSAVATHCTEQEANANKVERRLRKSAAALLMMPRRGEVFDGIVTGASEKGTWVRTLRPPVEGKLLVRGWSSVDVGDRVRVRLVDLDARQGFIDFALA
jgi:exoribonuclease-2